MVALAPAGRESETGKEVARTGVKMAPIVNIHDEAGMEHAVNLTRTINTIIYEYMHIYM